MPYDAKNKCRVFVISVGNVMTVPFVSPHTFADCLWPGLNLILYAATQIVIIYYFDRLRLIVLLYD